MPRMALFTIANCQHQFLKIIKWLNFEPTLHNYKHQFWLISAPELITKNTGDLSIAEPLRLLIAQVFGSRIEAVILAKDSRIVTLSDIRVCGTCDKMALGSKWDDNGVKADLKWTSNGVSREVRTAVKRRLKPTATHAHRTPFLA